MPRRSRFAKPDAIRVGPVTARAVKRYPKTGQPFYSREDGRAYWQTRTKGSRSTVWTGWATSDEAARAVAHAVATGGLDPSRRSGGHAGTVADLLARWMEAQRARERAPGAQRGSGLAANTVSFYDKAARHLTAWLGDLRPEQVTRDTVEGYVRARQERDKRPASIRTVEREVCIVKMAWKWGLQAQLIPERPFPSITVSVDDRVFKINHHTPSQRDAHRVVAALDGDVALVVWLLAVTGARVGAACSLRARDMDIGRGFIHFDWKTGRRAFPLRKADPALFAVLAERTRQRAAQDKLFDLAGHAQQQIRSALKGACQRAGVRTFTPHGLRRMVVTRLIRAKVDVATAADMLGHCPEVMLRKYAQVDDAAREAAALAGLGGFSRGRVIEGPWPASDDEATSEQGASEGGAV